MKELPRYTLFKARLEAAPTKSSFREAHKSKRCRIGADGFFEWTKAEDGGKNQHLIFLVDHEPFAFAGLWARNQALGITSCTILTAAADPAIEHLHDRKPIILDSAAHEQWIDPETSVDEARALLTQHRGAELQSYRVSRDVNSNKASGPI